MKQTSKCKYLSDGVCCNDSSKHLADYPSDEDCSECPYREIKGNDKARVSN